MTHSIEEMVQACEYEAENDEVAARMCSPLAPKAIEWRTRAARLRAAATALRRHKAVFAMIYDLAMANEWPDKSDGERIVQIAGIASMQDDEVIAAMAGSAPVVAGAGER